MTQIANSKTDSLIAPDDKLILSEYRKEINSRIIKLSRYTMPLYIVGVGGYFVYSDIFIRHIAFITPWRIPSIILAISFFILGLTALRKNILLVFVTYNLLLFSVCLMMAGITWSLFDSALLKSLVNGLLLAIFVVYINSFGGIKILMIHYIPILGTMIIIYFNSSPPLSVMIEFGNAVTLAFACLIAAQIQETLRYKEFTFRKVAEIERKKADVALSALKMAQNQLIQTEKLASLGELTAGIAHELQNPLNFVINFSEMSTELATELKGEIDNPNYDQELMISLTEDLIDNQQKIMLNGKRASSIVSAMMQHSFSGIATMEWVNVNDLVEKSIRLSYQAYKAKYIAFNVKIESYYEENLPELEIIPANISRVIINLLNNAFYAVETKKGTLKLVVVSTIRMGNNIAISIKDNGTGIPESLKPKIFQPFFTTKPTGEGTGLGLSLAYDIVSKGHGGKLVVNSTEGEGAEFIITLPLNTQNPG